MPDAPAIPAPRPESSHTPEDIAALERCPVATARRLMKQMGAHKSGRELRVTPGHYLAWQARQRLGPLTVLATNAPTEHFFARMAECLDHWIAQRRLTVHPPAA